MEFLLEREGCPTTFFSEKGSVEVFCTSLANNHKINTKPDLLYIMAIRNSLKNNSLGPIIFSRRFCYKIPDSAIEYAKVINNDLILNYLMSNRWLTSLGGF